ncbi:MAG: ferredoxin Fer [Halobacteriaceae archaeon]
MAIVEYLNYEVVEERGWDLYDEENFERAAALELSNADHGFVDVPQGQYILETAEGTGGTWPFSCRNGICSNCAAVLISGEVEMDGDQALSDEEIDDKAIRLTCVGRPVSEYIRLIYNAKHLGYLQDRIM